MFSSKLTCDGCGDTWRVKGDLLEGPEMKNRARVAAGKANGWAYRTRTDNDYCPKCKPKKKETSDAVTLKMHISGAGVPFDPKDDDPDENLFDTGD